MKEKMFFYKFRKVGFRRNKMLFIFSSCPKKIVDEINNKYKNIFYISLIKA